MITFDDFSKLELNVGKILEAKEHPDADKLLILKVDVGTQTIQLVAGIKSAYSADELVGRSIVVLINLEPRKVRGHVSEGMLLAAQGSSTISLIVPDKEVEAGSTIR